MDSNPWRSRLRYQAAMNLVISSKDDASAASLTLQRLGVEAKEELKPSRLSLLRLKMRSKLSVMT
jgi:hypothetical protein